MLYIWTNSTAEKIKKTIGHTIKEYCAKADKPVIHQVVPGPFPKVSAGDVVLACGATNFDWLKAQKLFPKGRAIGSMRGKPAAIDGAYILPTYDPGLCFRDYARTPDVQWDTAQAIRLHETGSLAPVMGHYRWVESFHELINWIADKHARTGKPVEMACDTETMGLDEYREGTRIISISFTVENDKSDAMYFEEGEAPCRGAPAGSYWRELWEQIKWLLTTKKVSLRGANWKYDSRWIYRHWKIRCTNHKFDTLLVGSLLDENRSNSLKLHAKLMTNKGGYEDTMDKFDMGHLEKVPKEDLLPYMGGDTDVTFEVAQKMKQQLVKDQKLTNFYIHLLHPSSATFEAMETNGVLVDVEYMTDLQNSLEAEMEGLHDQMVGMLPGVIRNKYADNLSITRSVILKEFLFTKRGLNLKPKMVTAKTEEPSTAINHLLMFDDHPVAGPFIQALKAYNSAAKTLGTFVVGFLKHLRSDGRWHPTYLLARMEYGNDASGTVTGRTAAKDPAVQTIPKHTKWAKRLRRGIIAPPGYCILQLDYSQGELRIAAVLAQEPTMIQAYLDGKDLHAITAAGINGYTFESFMLLPEDVRDALRSSGKAGNFGLIYGMQAPGFVTWARTAYGVVMDLEEGEQKRDAFFTLYNRLPEWHAESIAFAKKWEMIRSPLGRIRHLPLINSSDWSVSSQQERQAINSPVQSTLSDLMQLAMNEVVRRYGTDEAKMFMMTHDSVALYVPIDRHVLWAQRVKEVMETLPLKELFGWDSPLVFVADAEVSVADENGVHSLASLTKMKNL